ncbi:MAG: ROK family protein, partial [Bacilli bacterium]
MKYVPKLDPDFSPIVLKLREYEEKVSKATQKQKLVICLERNKGYNYRYELDVFADNTGFDEENYEIVERIVKSLLWIAGGYKIYIAGSNYLYERLKADYAKGGNREFDALFMSHVYENEFTVLKADYHEVPPLNQEVIVLEKDLSGCRIGFDAGGSDRKVAAVIDGEVVYSEEVVWYPKINSDPEYHREHIMEAMRTAASHMPRVDAIGVSSAGIYVDNRVMMASLFLKVPNELYDAKVKNMYIDIVRTFGADIPFRVANDGDVA